MTTSHPDAPAPIDLTAALKRTMGDAAFLQQMLSAFGDTLAGHLSAIGAALEARDAEALATAAHRLKGTALNLSLGHIADTALAVEIVGREGRLEDGEDALAALTQAGESFAAFLATIDWQALDTAD